MLTIAIKGEYHLLLMLECVTHIAELYISVWCSHIDGRHIISASANRVLMDADFIITSDQNIVSGQGSGEGQRGYMSV